MKLNVNGKEAYYTSSGRDIDKNQPSIVFVHGSGLSHVTWVLQTRYFAFHGYNTIAVDLPGHGNSEGESLKSIEDMASWLNKVVKHLGIKQHSIIGHSQGCLIALEYANKFPENLKSLVFVAGSYEIPVNKSLIELALSGDMESLNLMMKWGYGKSKQFIGGNPLQKILNSPREVREVLAVDLIACNNYKNGKKAIKEIKCPTFFIFGELDKMIKLDKGKEFSKLATNSKVHVIKNCGHMIILENAFEMREKIKEFLK